MNPAHDDFFNLSDEQIIPLVFQNPENYYHLIKRYEAPLLRYIKRLTSVAHPDAEDVLQEVFLKAYKNLRAFNKKLKFSSWLYRITHNEAISAVRGKKREIQFDFSANFLDRLGSDTEAPLLDIDPESLRLWIEELPHRYTDVILLKYFENKDYSEISDILKIPSGTVGTYLNRARRLLYKRIMKEKR